MVEITHIYREANQLVDCIVNLAFGQKDKQQYQSFIELPSIARRIMDIDKSQVPSLRVKTKSIINREA